MKVHLLPKIARKETGEGGIRRVLEAITEYLPERGIEFVDSMADADLVNAHAVDLKTDLPVVVSNHGLYWSGHEWPNWAYKANEQLIAQMKRATTKAVTVPSYWVANSLRRGMLINPIIVPHGIDIDFWQPLPHKDYVLWAKNRADHICDPAPLNYLAKRFPNQRFISTFGEDVDNTIITGRLPLEQIKPLIQQAGVYLASVEETGGITVLEAMACGVPPLASRKGANLEIVEHKVTGYLYDPDNEKDMELGLNYCLLHRDRLGTNARQYILEQRQWRHVIGGYALAYRRALSLDIRPKVSVVITAYNYDNLLPRSIQSVIEQDFEDWELFIVNDNSPDACGEIADVFAKEDHRINVIHNPQNVYLAEARNIGFRQARGDYFMALDADDALPPDALRLLTEALDSDPDIHIATGAMALIEEDGTEWVSTWPSEVPDYEHQIAYKNQVPYSSMYRREVWERTGGYRRRMKTAEDADFWTRAMSFGARPAKVTSRPTLIYTNHRDSMSHTEPPVLWTAWSPWSRLHHMTPYGNSGRLTEGFRQVLRYGPAKVTVIIPVGPSHDILLQDCLDSLVAQSFVDWEVILVNDTGESWVDDNYKLINPYLQGFPFVQIVNVNSEAPNGTAWARNRGIEQANSDFIVFLDADDYLQISALDIMYKAITQFQGWVYIDWYDQEGTHKQADEWTEDRLLKRAIGPITGMYALKDIQTVGGFDEKLLGWEDWDLHLKLYASGSCGSRIPVPLLTYRYQTGVNRERDVANKESLLQAIALKHEKLFDKGEFFMGCKKCPGGGGKRGLAVSRTGRNAPVHGSRTSTSEQDMELVEIMYVGHPKQKRRLKSKINLRMSYVYSDKLRRIYVLKGDVDWMTAHGDFERISQAAAPVQEDLASEKLEVGRMPTLPPPPEIPKAKSSDLPLDILPLKREIITLLQAKYSSVGELVNIPAAELVILKGIGPKRAEQIKEAVQNVVKSP